MENQFTEDQIKEGNKIIGRFMGYTGEYQEYHRSLDSMKPVIDKILFIGESEFDIDRRLQYGLESVQVSLMSMSLNKDVIDFWNEIIGAITWYEGAKIEYQAILNIKKETGTPIPKENWGVHETHCCKRHGCKYGEHDKCPVTLGLIKQAYGCETGSDFNEDCFGEELTPEGVFEMYEKINQDLTYEGFKKWFLESKIDIKK